MRGSLLWFALAAGWGLDSVLAAFRRNWVQAALTGFFALCFLAVGFFFRKREQLNRAVENQSAGRKSDGQNT